MRPYCTSRTTNEGQPCIPNKCMKLSGEVALFFLLSLNYIQKQSGGNRYKPVVLLITKKTDL